MALVLVRHSQGQSQKVLEIGLDSHTNRTGDTWHVCVHGMRNMDSMAYGWRATGDGKRAVVLRRYWLSHLAALRCSSSITISSATPAANLGC